MVEEKCIQEFAEGDRIQNFFIIKTLEIKINRNNKEYMDLTLGDRTGEVNAKLWDLNNIDENLYRENMLIKVRGRIVQWQAQLQLNIERIRPVEDSDGVSIEDFIQSAPYDPQWMYNELLKYLEKIQHTEIHLIVQTILEKKEKLQYFPAAKSNHHSIRGGLLYHILTMLRAGEKMLEVYPHLNHNLLYAGILLHDIAKIDEMDANELGIVNDYRVEGKLLGHIIQGIKEIEQVGRIRKDPDLMLLEHMV